MKAHVSTILIGVQDMDRTRRFYTDGLGWEIRDEPIGVLGLGPLSIIFASDGSSLVGFYERAGLAGQVGVSPEGSGFSGIVLTYVVRSEARVDEIIAEAEKAGATIHKPAGPLSWGGYGGTFADPDGYVWSISYSAQGENQPYAE